MSYKHISFVQRCKISAFWKAGYLQKDIAKELDINPSTVSRELKRNRRWNGVYCPEQAASFYKTRRQDSRKPKKFTCDVIEQVKDKLMLEWSPEQISGYGKRHGLFEISHERNINIFWLTKKLVVHCISIYDVARKDIVNAMAVPSEHILLKTGFLLMIGLRWLIKSHV